MSLCYSCNQPDGFHRDFCIEDKSRVPGMPNTPKPSRGEAKKAEPKVSISIPIVPEDAVVPGASDMEDIVRRLNNRPYLVKDSGKREVFESGMCRDTQEGKIQYTRLLDGPMLKRWAEHITKGAVKYPDIAPGVANWTQASGEAEMRRFKESAMRHFFQWLHGDTDEDHAAAVMFNINGAEFVKEKLCANKD